MVGFDRIAERQLEVSRVFTRPEEWTRKAILNVARVGRFSSDRTIREYAEDTWHLKPAVITVPDEASSE